MKHDRIVFKFYGSIVITKENVFDYYEANDIEYDVNTTEPTTEDFQATAESWVENEPLEMEIIPVEFY